MALESGASLGAYTIVSKLGEGGMGQVYRATDTKLGRDVALKILPDLFITDADRLARFKREAHVLASLNHPNIAAIYGIEDSGATHALVMELVDGEDLSQIIARGSTTLADALAMARQIADALEAAHEQGIVHRDLKPANIKVRSDGTVKVLDFGLAKAVDPASTSSADAMNSPTMTARATQMGMILGTAAYMAPEQAKGRVVDRRADVWAFGVVLFEMLSGRRAFDGDDISEVLAGVLKLEPEWNALPADLPAPVRRLLSRCLEKDPKKRLRDVAEGMLQLEEGLASSAAAPSSVAAPAPARPLWQRAWPIAAAVLVTAATMGISAWRAPAAGARSPIRFTIEPPSSAPTSLSGVLDDIAISPDGKVIVYTATEGGQLPGLWTRHLDELSPAVLRGGEIAISPFVSPQNDWVGFVDASSASVIKKVSLLGGPAVLVTRAKSGVYGATWTHDGMIVFGSEPGPLMIVSEAGGEPKSLTTIEAGQPSGHAWPSEVPGTSIILFTTLQGGVSSAQLAAFDRATGRAVSLKIPGSHARYLPSGHIIFATPAGVLQAVGFDPKTMATEGSPFPVVESVIVKASGAAIFDVARDGRLVYAKTGAELARYLTWTDRTGKDTPIAAPPHNYYYARLSPDATQISLDIRQDNQDTWIWNLKRESLLRLTDKTRANQYGLWSPDSQSIVFRGASGNSFELMRMRADGTGAVEQITDTARFNSSPFPNAITPDGKQVIFRVALEATKNDLYVATIGGDRSVTPLLATEHDERNATLSPDGKWMAYESDLSGRYEVYVRPFPNADAQQYTLSAAGGNKPLWSPTGREIFYLSADRKMMAVPVETKPTFSAGKPVMQFDVTSYFTGAIGRNYDVSADGKRFVMIKDPASSGGRSQPLTVVADWLDTLRGRTR